MKTVIDAVIVVEGKSDVSFLDSFIQAIFVTTNGSEIPGSTIDYLITLKKDYPLIILTDPDAPGKRIRDILDQKISGLIHVYIDKKNAIRKNKVGVAEATKEEIMTALRHAELCFERKESQGSLTMKDLWSLGLTGEQESAGHRQRIADQHQLGYVSTAKEFLKRINIRNISYYMLRKEVDEHEDR